MQCSEVEKWIEPLIDNEISSLLKRDVETHVGECQSCCRILENSRILKNVLKNSLPLLSPPSRLDVSVTEAFYRRQKKRESNKTATWGSAIFRRVVIPKPIFALFAVFIAALLGLAFQLGRVSVSPVQSPTLAKDFSELSQKESDESAAPPAKIIEVPVTKVVERPVIKEKIVTRYIYVNKRNEKNNQIKSVRNNSQTDNSELSGSIAENGYITQTSLKGFQPMEKIKTRVARGDKTNER